MISKNKPLKNSVKTDYRKVKYISSSLNFENKCTVNNFRINSVHTRLKCNLCFLYKS